MTRTMLRMLALVLASTAVFAQSAATPANTSDVSEKIQKLEQMLDAQQQQIRGQQQQIESLKQELEKQPTAAHSANSGSSASTALAPLNVSLGQTTGQKRPEKKPPLSDSIVLANGKIRIGAVAFADWALYPQTGFGPAFLDLPTTYPGPGNDNYNSFDVTRTYVNFLFSPTDWVTFRVTPDVYRDIVGVSGTGVTTGDNTSRVSRIGNTPDGSLSLRLKYGYAEFPKLFSDGAFKGDNMHLGMQTNPLIDWEEGLYGYRFVSLVPWNFISLSSSYTGVSLNGPIKFNGKQYLDYQIGAFNNSNFHAFEQAETKTGMARVSFYPLGASSKYQGLGFTGFIDYGYTNTAPDASTETPVVRVAALAHYQSRHDGAQLAVEYDLGRNAGSSGNMFSAGTPIGSFAYLNTLAGAILAGTHTRQQGYAGFGHLNIPNSRFAVFGLYQYFQPNTRIPTNPLDFQRVVAGVSYRVNKNLCFALDNQDVLYKHSQFTYPAASLATFSPSLAASNPNGIVNAVPKSVKALFANMEFTF